MEKNNYIDINKMVFSNTPAENKLHYINTLSKEEIRKATNDTILRIFKECCNGRDKFYINSKRRAGNNLGSSNIWNSCIEFIYEYKGKAYINFYVQNTKTDWGESVSFDSFKRDSEYNGWCDYLNTRFRYDSTDVTNVIRCILAEYVYYTEIEKTEREEQERLNSILHYSIVNPVYNRFYNEWRCKYQGGYPGAPHDRLDRYHRGEKAVEEYAKANVDKLCGKSKEELQAIYTKIFEETK
jgi:hypothetical protein